MWMSLWTTISVSLKGHHLDSTEFVARCSMPSIRSSDQTIIRTPGTAEIPCHRKSYSRATDAGQPPRRSWDGISTLSSALYPSQITARRASMSYSTCSVVARESANAHGTNFLANYAAWPWQSQGYRGASRSSRPPCSRIIRPKTASVCIAQHGTRWMTSKYWPQASPIAQQTSQRLSHKLRYMLAPPTLPRRAWGVSGSPRITHPLCGATRGLPTSKHAWPQRKTPREPSQTQTSNLQPLWLTITSWLPHTTSRVPVWAPYPTIPPPCIGHTKAPQQPGAPQPTCSDCKPYTSANMGTNHTLATLLARPTKWPTLLHAGLTYLSHNFLHSLPNSSHRQNRGSSEPCRPIFL